MTTDTTNTVEINSGGSLGGRRICIVGAGIGGLTAALAFARRGAQVEVFEQAAEISEVGAGIQITPNGARVLAALGLEDALAQAGLVAAAVVPMDALTGHKIARFSLTEQTPPYRFFHRAALIDILADACEGAGVNIALGQRVLSASQEGVVETEQGSAAYDLCIGADGVHSVCRSTVDANVPATFTGQVAWRAIVPAPHMAPREARIWMAPKRHVVTYPISDNALNIVAVQEREDWAEDGWHHADDPANLRGAFSDVGSDLAFILDGVEQTHLWGLFRYPVATTWHSGRVVILGDAAHPTLPFLAQGANLAIEDAYVLAACCDTDIPKGLVQYQAERKPRVTRAIAAANSNARNYHLSGLRRTIAHRGLKTLGFLAPGAFLNRMDWLYGLDVTQ